MSNWKRTVAVILSVLLAALIVGMCIHVRREEREQAQELEKLAQQDELRRHAKQQVGEEVLRRLLDSVGGDVPGIVCWGDESMAGNQTGNLPARLSEIVDSELFETIRKGLLDQAGLYSAKGLGINVVNKGLRKEGFREILARTGAREMVLGEDYTISASVSDKKQNLTMTDKNGNLLLFYDQNGGFGIMTIQDVTGKLYYGDGYYDAVHANYAFGREEAGVSVTAPAGTVILSSTAEELRNRVPVFFFAESEEITAEEFIAGIRDVLGYYHDQETYVVICTTEANSLWNKKLTRAFGEHYIRNDKAVTNMTKTDYQSLAERTFQNLRDQGLFDGILQAVEKACSDLETGLRQIK